MKTIKINSDRRLSQSYLFIGYLDENNAETIKFEIPEEYQEYSKMACFKTKDGTFTKTFDELTTNYLTLTSDITKYNEVDLSITFGALANLVGNYFTPETINYGYVYANKVGLDSSGNVVINGTTGMNMGSVTLMKNASSISGYDSTKTQVLKNVKGTIQWVSE